MSEKIIQLKEGIIKEELKDLVRSNVEETLNGLLFGEITSGKIYENRGIKIFHLNTSDFLT